VGYTFQVISGVFKSVGGPMMFETLLAKIRNVPQNPETVFDPFAQEMIRLLGDDLQTVASFGSAVSGDYVYARSNINMVLVFKNITVTQLKVMSVPMEQWMTRGFDVPRIFTTNDLERSLDVFPLLFMEIRDNHRILFGPDPFKTIPIEKTYLRIQVEQMLRTKMAEARTEFIASGESLRTFESMLSRSFNTIFPLLRGLLFLKGLNPSVRKDVVVSTAEEQFQLEPGILTDSLRQKMGLLRISDKYNLLKFYEQYLRVIEKLVQLADKIEVAEITKEA